MSDLKISQMLDYQRRLYALHQDKWAPHTPQYARESLLWSIDEIGEVIAIIKKKGDDAIMDNPQVRRHYVEECCDVMMYWLDMMDCYGITAEEFSREFIRKAESNLSRTWKENEHLYED